ncbi:glutathione S-transferase theta-1-like isoform X1 [Dunckerocampus dactyliophorus]|uniref:glutathione S-transferase theta-1-like isoform X1 n=1 Tax=Dunckerocampus dactyliophorus TaxID=161453 RepID=UPI002405F0A6|nr:glutathione S-transferase theta-1-like isoform X1 [Dunckerocampus dactyliophorus]
MPPKSHTKSTLWRSGEQQSAHFTKLNPMQKVPVLKDDGFVLTESDAILKYLCRKYAVAEHWYPQQPERRARVDEYTAWHHTNTRPHAAKVFLLEVLFPTRSGSAVDEAGLARAVSQLDEPMFLRKQAFLCGDDITLADLRAHAASRWQQTRPAGTSPAAALEDTGPVGAGRPLPRLPRRPVCHQRLPQGQAVTQPMLM